MIAAGLATLAGEPLLLLDSVSVLATARELLDVSTTLAADTIGGAAAAATADVAESAVSFEPCPSVLASATPSSFFSTVFIDLTLSVGLVSAATVLVILGLGVLLLGGLGTRGGGGIRIGACFTKPVLLAIAMLLSSAAFI